MASTGGHPIAGFSEANFTCIDKVQNKSGHYFWKCNHCGDDEGSEGACIQGWDNNLPMHIVSCCKVAPPVIFQEAHTFIQGKTQSISTHSQATIGESSASDLKITPIRKHKEALDDYVDYPLMTKQIEDANTRLLHEAVQVQEEDLLRLKPRKKLTLLLDGWEDQLKQSLYGSVAVEVNHHPIVLALEDMTISQKAMEKLEIDDGKNLIAVTTDNPTVMQAFCQKFQEIHPNTLIGDIITCPLMKKVIRKTTHIVTFFNSSHYWGGQLNEETKGLGVRQRLKQNCESCCYALILHCLSVKAHKNPLFQICIHPNAQRKINNQSPVASDVIDIVLHKWSYWMYLEQLIKTVKPLVNMSQLQLDEEDNTRFWMHAKSVFNRHFHAINTDHHSLALFLHPMCHKFAIGQVASGHSIEFMVKVALEIVKLWNWDKGKAEKLIKDMQDYNISHAPFAGGHANGLSWWESLPVTSDTHPLKSLTITILSIFPHAGDVEQLFSDLGSIQSQRHCNLSINTFETLGKIHANLCYHIHTQNMASGKPTQ
ncbi:hypothetical protein F5J12DRAFT_785554 [Pisolithus orientalis]|uniref:uncharacterized protein n=1 Tax=Pisolithus orientalis TaxID=936130 RepID=UPI002224B64C|nr:uncharacterized protein F5J12DRAFT_785554 [Pisolithus orientalis]KAI5995785.1 hypothetical protein F5J12DRAFT_785554 [Pisolithus orientalis]